MTRRPQTAAPSARRAAAESAAPKSPSAPTEDAGALVAHDARIIACRHCPRLIDWCATIGREVTVTLPGGKAISGPAVGVDWAGRLEVATAQGPVPVSAGDVVHLRPSAE